MEEPEGTAVAVPADLTQERAYKMPLTCNCKILISNQLNKKTHRHIYRGKINASVCACGLCGILLSLAEAKVKQKFLQTYEKIGNFRRNSFRRLLGGGNRQRPDTLFRKKRGSRGRALSRHLPAPRQRLLSGNDSRKDGDDTTCRQKRNIGLRDAPRELYRTAAGMPEARRKMAGIEREQHGSNRYIARN